MEFFNKIFLYLKSYVVLIILLIVVVIRIVLITFGNNQNQGINTQKTQAQVPKWISVFRAISLEKTQELLPSPHSELLLGMVIGLDELSKTPSFKKALKQSGTIHVVVVSGFNITLVFDMVFRIIGSRYKVKNLILAEIITLFYSILCGFEPPVVRSWIMGSVVGVGKFYGRSINTFLVLTFSALIMLLISPELLFELSFQLSFLATLGLVVLSKPIQNIVHSESISSTLAAQTFVWPVIAYNFKTISLVSFLINPVILWSVPTSTLLGFVFLFVSYINSFLGFLVALLIYPFLDFFIRAVYFADSLWFASVSLEVRAWFVIIYYVLLTIFVLMTRKSHNKAQKQI